MASILTGYADCVPNITWRASDIVIIFDDEQTADPIVTARIETPAGTIEAMAAVLEHDTWLRLTGLHIQSADGRRIDFGPANLRRLADAFAEELGFDGILVEGAPRTTGANPGRRQILRFPRRFFLGRES